MNNLTERLSKLSPQQLTLLVIELQARLAAQERRQCEPVAIIGIGCRFPGGATSPERFWRLLHAGVDAIGELPADRWDMAALYDPDPGIPGKVSTRWGGFLPAIDQFDAAFFGISPREAACMDPQHRIFLEVAWEALEDAGLTKARLAGSRTGVFAGVSNQDYAWLHCDDLSQLDIYSGTGAMAHNAMTGRLSYLLDLRGPSMPVDTACSSSLVAVHLACQSLRSGESDIALAGGVNIFSSPLSMMITSRMGILAPDGRCKTFDARANGFVRGEGSGVVVLKRLSDALADGDHIWALIRGTAINQDGKSASLTAPSVLAQQAVIRQALHNAQLEPEQVSYVETHGTGTQLGDPIEIEALAATYGQPAGAAQPCILGALKTNLGHLESAAGVAGLIKSVLALHHGNIPPNLHFDSLNPHMTLDGTRLAIPSTAQPWPAGAQARYAGVSSFGWSGTNAHAIVQEAPAAPARPTTTAPRHSYLLPLSARSPQALAALAARYQAWLGSDETAAARLHDICYTASIRRTHFEHRLAVVGASQAELAAALGEWVVAAREPSPAAPLPGGSSRGAARCAPTGSTRLSLQPAPAAASGLVFVFSGQGSQWVGMGQQLMREEPRFRAALAACDEALQRYVNWSLLDVLNATPEQEVLSHIDVIQPTLFALQVALAVLWQSWGIKPDAVIGHSMGEVAAAHVAGALSLDDAARIICHRSQLMRRTSGQGAMAVVELAPDEARAAIAGREACLAVAVYNSPRSTVLSGDPATLDLVLAELETQDIFCRKVQVDVASHSPQMEPLKRELVHELALIQPQTAAIPFYSTVTATIQDGTNLDATYWGRNLREPVQFAHTVQRLLADGHQLFVEISPHPLLVHAIAEVLPSSPQPGLALPSLRRDVDERRALLDTWGQLYTAGYPLAWERLYPNGGHVVRLPTYTWQRERYWKVSRDMSALNRKAAPVSALSTADMHVHPLLGWRRPSPLHDVQFETQFTRVLTQHFDDHRFGGQIIFGASLYLELAHAAAQACFGQQGIVQIENLTIQQIMNIPEALPLTVQTIVAHPVQAGQTSFQVWSRPTAAGQTDAAWQRHATGQLRISDPAAPPPGRPARSQRPIRAVPRPLRLLISTHRRRHRATRLAPRPRGSHTSGWEWAKGLDRWSCPRW